MNPTPCIVNVNLRLAIILYLLMSIPTLGSAAQDATLRLDPATTHQTIDGFGASGAWWSPTVGAWDDTHLDPVLDLLFTDQGAALSIFRYNLGAGGGGEIRDPWRRASAITQDQTGVNLNDDANALRVLEGVRQRGVERFVIFSNSPPADLTLSGMASGGPDGGENLTPEAAPAFAQWLIDRAEAITEAYQLPDVALSPVNEPQWNWGGDGRRQEGAHYKPQTALAVLRATAEELDRRGSALKLIGPEAGAWDRSSEPYLEQILADPVVSKKLHRLAIHSYHSNNRDRRRLTRWLDERGRPIPVAMTEWCELRNGYDYTMDSALVMAEVMHRDLAEAGVVEWSYWLAVSPYRYRDGLIHIDRRGRNQDHQATKRLWTLAHYSRFIRPGAVRIDAALEGEAADGLFVSAYRSADQARLVAVLTNPTESTVEITLPADDVADATAFLTDADRDLEPVGIASKRIALPPESLVTILLPIEE